MLDGKKTEKMHVRLTEDLAREVRAIADLESRPIQDQIRVLIVLGVQYLRHGYTGDSRRSASHVAAQEGTQTELGAPPIAARRRVTPQRKTA